MSIATMPAVAKQFGIDLKHLENESDDRLLDALYEAVAKARPEALQELEKQVVALQNGNHDYQLSNGTNVREAAYDPDSKMGYDMMMICGVAPIRAAINRHFAKGPGDVIPGYRNGVVVMLADGEVPLGDMLRLQMQD